MRALLERLGAGKQWLGAGLQRLGAGLPALGLLIAVPALAQVPGDAACARDVLIANSMQRQAIDQLEAVADDEAGRCRVWRRHVDTMRRIAGVYGRCLTGAERVERLNQVQGSEKEFAGLVKGRCKGL